MDTLSVIVQESNSFDLKSFVVIARDIATIIAILIGLYLGNKGLRHFILDSIIKQKISSLHDHNNEIFLLTKDIIGLVNAKENLDREITEKELNSIKENTQKLVNQSNGASTEVATLSYFLHETIKRVKPHVKTKSHEEIRLASEFYTLLYNSCVKINKFSSNIVDIPKKIKLEPFNEIKKSIHKYLNKTDTYKIKGYQLGINLNANSPLSLLFASIIGKSTSSFIFIKYFYQLLRTNTPIVYNLFLNKLYFPPILERVDEMPIFGKKPLHLIRFNVIKTVIPANKNDKINFYYSNLNPAIRFVVKMKKDTIKNNYKDSFIKNINTFGSLNFDVQILPNETIKLTCDKESAEQYYRQVKRIFKRKLRYLKNS